SHEGRLAEEDAVLEAAVEGVADGAALPAELGHAGPSVAARAHGARKEEGDDDGDEDPHDLSASNGRAPRNARNRRIWYKAPMRALLACLALVAACAPAPLADESTTGAEAPSPEAPTVESLFLHVDEERPCLLVARDGAYTAGRPLETAVRPRPPFPEGLRA